jgi:hypothetical protein
MLFLLYHKTHFLYSAHGLPDENSRRTRATFTVRGRVWQDKELRHFVLKSLPYTYFLCASSDYVCATCYF